MGSSWAALLQSWNKDFGSCSHFYGGFPKMGVAQNGCRWKNLFKDGWWLGVALFWETSICIHTVWIKAAIPRGRPQPPRSGPVFFSGAPSLTPFRIVTWPRKRFAGWEAEGSWMDSSHELGFSMIFSMFSFWVDGSSMIFSMFSMIFYDFLNVFYDFLWFSQCFLWLVRWIYHSTEA